MVLCGQPLGTTGKYNYELHHGITVIAYMPMEKVHTSLRICAVSQEPMLFTPISHRPRGNQPKN